MRVCVLLLGLIIVPAALAQGPSGTHPAGRSTWFWHVATAVPRQVGRTTANMFTMGTCRASYCDRGLAIAEWVNVAAVIADNKTTLDAEARCPRCTEKNTLGIKRLERLTLPEFALQTVGLAFLETNADQYPGEQIHHDENRWWRDSKYLMPTYFVVGHTWASVHNSRIP